MKIKEVAESLGVCDDTIRKNYHQYGLTLYMTPDGDRRFDADQVDVVAIKLRLDRIEQRLQEIEKTICV